MYSKVINVEDRINIIAYLEYYADFSWKYVFLNFFHNICFNLYFLSKLNDIYNFNSTCMCLGGLCGDILSLVIGCLNLSPSEGVKFKFIVLDCFYLILAVGAMYIPKINKEPITILYRMNISLIIYHLILLVGSL